MRAFKTERRMMLVNYYYLNNGEIIDTSYGFINNKGIEVCSENELDDM